MGVQRNIGAEWRDEQADSRYPFTDASTLEGSNGILIEKDIILDAVIYIIGAIPPVYLKSITSEARLITITIANTDDSLVVTGSFDPFDSGDTIPLIDSYGRPAGLLVCDAERITRFRSWPFGVYTFDLTAEFVESVVVPFPNKHLGGFVLPDGSMVTGDVWMVGEDGVVLREDEGAIRIDLVGDPLFKRKLCTATGGSVELFVTPNYLKTINGIKPDEYGNFTITANNELAGDTILRIYPDSTNNVVKIEFVGQRLESVI
jgi:hypothetical protein